MEAAAPPVAHDNIAANTADQEARGRRDTDGVGRTAEPGEVVEVCRPTPIAGTSERAADASREDSNTAVTGSVDGKSLPPTDNISSNGVSSAGGSGSGGGKVMRQEQDGGAFYISDNSECRSDVSPLVVRSAAPGSFAKGPGGSAATGCGEGVGSRGTADRQLGGGSGDDGTLGHDSKKRIRTSRAWCCRERRTRRPH
ncbi:unnamed protein product [Sphacelaria rigidula]